MTEHGVVEMMSASPLESMRGRESLCCAISALGRTALTNILFQETKVLTNPDGMAEEPHDRISGLRLVIHDMVYLDSLFGRFRFFTGH
jgi:hypothetical protein